MYNKKFISETDEQLMKLFQSGNRDAFDEICLRYKDKAVNFLFRFVGDRAAAQDLAQNSFLKVYMNKDSYREIAKFSTWFYTIASNLAKTELRKNKRRQTLPFSAVGDDDREFIASAPIDDHEDEQSGIKNDHKIIHQSLIELDEEFRNIIIFRDIQELSYDEISKIIQIPLGTVKSRINRGRLKLKEIIKKKGVKQY